MITSPTELTPSLSVSVIDAVLVTSIDGFGAIFVIAASLVAVTVLPPTVALTDAVFETPPESTAA